MSHTAKTVAKIIAAAQAAAEAKKLPAPKIGALYDFYDNIPRGGR